MEPSSAIAAGRWSGKLAAALWGEAGRSLYLIVAASCIMLVRLGAAELWTEEGRWAAICTRMMRSGDYLHPYLFGKAYYDKPLLSYWLMAAAAHLLGGLSELALRLPSALSGILAVWCLYRLGAKRFDRATGLAAGFLLTSCCMFVFWSRVASADMLNVAGTLAAVTWYFERRDQPGFVTFAVLMGIAAVTCLMKGLLGVAVVALVIAPDLVGAERWRALLRPSFFASILLGVALYAMPFLLSAATQPSGYSQHGLAMVFRENAVRYFHAFDHRGPIYLYWLELPVYTLPWALFLPLVIWSAWRRWPTMNRAQRWVLSTCMLIFLFLTASSSRRSYYVLPLVPFALLATAEWLCSEARGRRAEAVAGSTVVAALGLMLVWFGVLVPAGFRRGGERVLVREVRAEAEAKAPWSEWRILQCGAPPAVAYYFDTGQDASSVPGDDPNRIRESLQRNPRQILVTKREFLDQVRSVVPAATVIEERSRVPRLFRSENGSKRDLIALVP